MKVLLQIRLVIIILIVLVIASLESPDQVIIILILILLLALILILVTAPPIFRILLSMLAVRELMLVALARVIDSIVVVVATELIESFLIKEVSIGVIEPLVLRKYVEVHVIIIPALDLFHLAHRLLSAACRLAVL